MPKSAKISEKENINLSKEVSGMISAICEAENINPEQLVSVLVYMLYNDMIDRTFFDNYILLCITGQLNWFLKK
jgi:hypothetical protein